MKLGERGCLAALTACITSCVAPRQSPISAGPTGSATLSARIAAHGSAIAAIAYSPDGSVVATGGGAGDSSLAVWETGRWHLRSRVPSGLGKVNALAFADGGRVVVAAGMNGQLAAWGWQRAGAYRLFNVHYPPYCGALAIDPTGGRLAIPSAQQTAVRLVSLKDGVSRRTIDLGGLHASALCFAPDGRLLLVGTEEGRLEVLSLDTAQPVSSAGGTGRVSDVAALPGRNLMLVARERAVTVWDPVARSSVRELSAPNVQCLAISMSRDGRVVAAGGGADDADSPAAIAIWDTREWKQMATIPHHRDWPQFTVSPDGKYLVEGSNSGILWIYTIRRASA